MAEEPTAQQETAGDALARRVAVRRGAKNIARRRRPDRVEPALFHARHVAMPRSASFPSGQAGRLDVVLLTREGAPPGGHRIVPRAGGRQR